MFDQTNERIVLITATVQKDLSNTNPVVQRLALTLIANICSTEMGQSLFVDVVKLSLSPDPFVQKSTAIAAAPFCGNVPISLRTSALSLPICSTTQTMQFLSGGNSLKSLFDSRPTQEFHFGVFNDQFLQILAALKLLSAIVTGVEIQRNSGRSLLLAAVSAIGQTAKKASLRSLAFNQVGRLFSSPQPNLLYSALSMFSRILDSNSTIIDRGSSDSQALQRYKLQVVHCLSHRDPSIRRRALDVVAALVDETNLEALIPEIMTYLKLADRDSERNWWRKCLPPFSGLHRRMFGISIPC